VRASASITATGASEQCKDCGGSSICQHNRHRSICKDCGGTSICQHNRQRSICKDCRGTGTCQHNRERSKCKDCVGSSICAHYGIRRQCKDCKRRRDEFDAATRSLETPLCSRFYYYCSGHVMGEAALKCRYLCATGHVPMSQCA